MSVLSSAHQQLRDARLRLGIMRARRDGVVIGDDCIFRGLPGFGSEPYLISIGNRVRIASHVQMITHDGGISVDSYP